MLERLIHRPIKFTLLIGAVSFFCGCQQPNTSTEEPIDSSVEEHADWPDWTGCAFPIPLNNTVAYETGVNQSIGLPYVIPISDSEN